ncbi:neck protein [Porphyromonas phage phage010a_HG1691old]|uniref:Phage virion morphogenesis protein n=1 Tax=Porphyromonas gingivalis TaxID=837 RepID=A0AAE9XEH7_PORGN|nr:phage virion morphogenesis protein [Porphyromonas gingivalis]WCF98645.1 phage virion morphogenesis protein [Porphyromonas gingivalis]
MTIHELNEYLASLADEIIEDAAHIVAETATSHFKQTFTEKAFDGNPWAPSRMPKHTGSLLIDKGALVNSIRPAYVSRERVVISAGNDQVPYAQIHNEGGMMEITPKMRRFFWAKFHDTKDEKWRSLALSRKPITVPKRQFMGDSQSLNDEIHERLEGYTQAILNSK